jgi:hypothetical protein
MIHIAAPIFVILSLISGGVGCDDSFEERAARAASNFIGNSSITRFRFKPEAGTSAQTQ